MCVRVCVGAGVWVCARAYKREAGCKIEENNSKGGKIEIEHQEKLCMKKNITCDRLSQGKKTHHKLFLFKLTSQLTTTPWTHSGFDCLGIKCGVFEIQ